MELQQPITVNALIARLENLPEPARAEPAPDRMQAMAWLALAPAWPCELAVRGFPSGSDGRMETGDAVVQFGDLLKRENLILITPGEPPLEGPWYRMEQQQRTTTLRNLLTAPLAGAPFLQQELLAAARQMEQAAKETGARLNAPLERWVRLSKEASLSRMADALDSEVDRAIAAAEENPLFSSEADDWVKTAQPLSEIFGGELEVSFARAQRRLDLFRRSARDQSYLANYYPRPDLEEAFESMLNPAADDSWALHYVGVGGIGKTMLIRRIRAQTARERALAVGHVDFDHLNPDYPRRAPGLLLMGFVEDLQLSASPDVVRIFRQFQNLVRSIHEKLQSTFVASAQDYARQGVDYARAFFVQGLRQIWSLGQRPVLILDTCEELARIRGGELPENVKFTFDLLESIHADVPELRVVFSGRRPLAREGVDWEWPGCLLPKRDYLRLREVLPFTRLEAEGMLGAFTNHTNQLHVPGAAFDKILELSSVERDAAGRHFTSLTRAVRKPSPAAAPASAETIPGAKYYYPYDLDLYATWITGDPSFDPAKLSAGKHVYVKDRIVNRAQYELRPWLPHLTILGRFDQNMVTQLTELTPRDAAALWELLVQQEWTEPYQDAQREEVWALLPRARTRLLAYYADEEPELFRAARQRISELLRRITLERPFRDLTPEYFEACLEVSIDEPMPAALWWDAVERKLADEERWDWGRGLTDLLLHDESVAGRVDGAATPSKPECVLRPAILATYAAVNIHGTAEDRERNSKQGVWEEVLEKCERHPAAAGRQHLRRRAQIAIADDLSAFGLLETGNDPQLIAGGLARKEKLVERLEAGQPQIGAIFLRQRPFQLPPETLPELRAFAQALAGRLALLETQNRSQTGRADLKAAIAAASGATNRQCWLDWRAPDNLDERLRLELARWEKPARPPSFSSTIDGDRLRAAVLEWDLHERVPGEGITVVTGSPNVAVCQPLCNAHRAFPPYAAVAVEAMGAHGNLDVAVRLAGKILSDSKYPLEFREAVDRAQLDLVIRFLLFEERIGLENSLRDSTLLEDVRSRAILGLLQLGFGNLPGEYLKDDDRRFLKRDLDSDTVPKDRPRRIAGRLFLRALIRLADEPRPAVRLLKQASASYETAHDPVGQLICTIAMALVHADSGAKEDLISNVESGLVYLAPISGLAHPLLTRRIEGAAGWTAYLSEIERCWRPWMVRLAACDIRTQEFDKPGEESRKLLEWVSERYPPEIAAAMTKPLAGRTQALRFKSELTQILGVLVLVTAALGIYLGYKFLLGLFHIHWSTLANVGSLLGLIIAISLIVTLVPRLVGWFLGLVSYAYTVDRVIVPVAGLASPNDPLVVPRTIQQRFRMFRFYGTQNKRTSEPVSLAEPYAKQSAILMNDVRLIKRIPQGSNIDNTIIVDESSAAAPWEAIFGLLGGNFRTFDQVRYRFRRMIGSRSLGVEDAFPESIRAVTWSWDPSASRLFAAEWITAKHGESHELESPNLAGTMRTDSGIGILHVVAQPLESSSGVVLRPSGNEEIRPAQLIAAAPAVRVCIVQDIPEEHNVRGPSDRFAANVARRFGFQLHKAGVPAVVTIPPLPEHLSATVLAIFAVAIMKYPTHGERVLWTAVQDARVTIAKLVAEANRDPAIATEIAFDLCYYAPQRLNLSKISGGS